MSLLIYILLVFYYFPDLVLAQPCLFHSSAFFVNLMISSQAMTSEASVDISIIPALADIGKCDKKFNPEKCAALFGICAANTVNVNLLALLEGSMEIKKLLGMYCYIFIIQL